MLFSILCFYKVKKYCSSAASLNLKQPQGWQPRCHSNSEIGPHSLLCTKNQFLSLMSYVNSTPSLFTSRFKLQSHLLPLSLPGVFLVEGGDWLITNPRSRKALPLPLELLFSQILRVDSVQGSQREIKGRHPLSSYSHLFQTQKMEKSHCDPRAIYTQLDE